MKIDSKTELHPNSAFVAFIRTLPVKMRQDYEKELLQNLQDYTPHQLKNWLAKKSKVPIHYQPVITEITKDYHKKLLTKLLPEQDFNNVSITIFSDMTDKTTIKVERAKSGMTQQMLAEKAEVSTQTISRLEIKSSLGEPIGFSFETARKIAGAFGLKTNDFKEFSD